MKFSIKQDEIGNESICNLLFKNSSRQELVICTDTRELSKGDIFLALSGDSFDGHNFTDQAIEAGAEVVIVSKDKKIKTKYENKIIKVENSLTFMQTMAASKLEVWKQGGKRKVISLTGSNGKTTNKEILFELLNSILPNKIAATQGNFNNHIGVPLTIFNLKTEEEFAIIEFGTNHPGEIKVLCDIVKPDFGYITNIGHSHLEFFENREGVFKEKRELFDSCIKNSHEKYSFFLNDEDYFLKQLDSNSSVVRIGKFQNDKITIKDGILEIEYDKKVFKVVNKNIREGYNLFNLGMCLIISLKIYPQHEKALVEMASKLKLPDNNRSTWVNKLGKQFFLDAYNANPSSMEVSLKSFVDHLSSTGVSLSKALFILGDMNELGDSVESHHMKIAKSLDVLGIENVAFIGHYRAYYQKGFSKLDMGSEELGDFMSDWKHLLNKFDFFFIKGSRSVGLEKLVENI